MARPIGPRKIYRYSEEFRATAVRLSQLAGVAVKDVATSLDVHPFVLSRWRRDAREGRRVTEGVTLDGHTRAQLRMLPDRRTAAAGGATGPRWGSRRFHGVGLVAVARWRCRRRSVSVPVGPRKPRSISPHAALRPLACRGRAHRAGSRNVASSRTGPHAVIRTDSSFARRPCDRLPLPRRCAS
jgi:hypothetical protein